MTPEALDLAVWPIFAKMSARGIRVDVGALKRLKAEVEAELEAQEAALVAYAGRDLNPHSSQDVGRWLRAEGLSSGRLTKGGQAATDERTLSMLTDLHPGPACILECRGLRKLVSTFIDPVLAKVERMAEPTVHPRWRLTTVKSGRPSCEDPNLLAFPTRDAWGKRVRQCFVARPGYRMVSVDFSQIEPRVAAALSGDDALCAVFSDGRDLYADMARRIFRLAGVDDNFKTEPWKTQYRQPAKIILLGCVLYGMQADRLYTELIRWGCGTPSRPFYSMEECERFVRDRFKPYPRLATLSANTSAAARMADGWASTEGGRRRFLPALLVEGHRWPARKLREEAERQAFNHLIQGTAQEKMKAAMLCADGKYGAFPLLQIYDEMVYEAPGLRADDAAEGLSRLMATSMDSVEIVAGWSVANNWGDLK